MAHMHGSPMVDEELRQTEVVLKAALQAQVACGHLHLVKLKALAVMDWLQAHEMVALDRELQAGNLEWARKLQA